MGPASPPALGHPTADTHYYTNHPFGRALPGGRLCLPSASKCVPNLPAHVWSWERAQPERAKGPASQFQISSFNLQSSNFKHQVPTFKIQNSKLKHQTSNFKHQTSNFKLQTSNFKLQAASFKLQIQIQTSNFQLTPQTSNIKLKHHFNLNLQTAIFKLQTSNC